jgi:hypothetical protein
MNRVKLLGVSRKSHWFWTKTATFYCARFITCKSHHVKGTKHINSWGSSHAFSLLSF